MLAAKAEVPITCLIELIIITSHVKILIKGSHRIMHTEKHLKI